MSERANQNGSVVTFVIVGVVLAAVVAGGVYLVNQRNKQGSNSQPSTSQPAPITSTSNENTSSNTGGQSSTNSPPTSQSTQPSATVPSSQGRLPTTGPAEDGLRLLFVGVLVGIATAYVRSRQQRRQVFSL